MKKLSKRRQEHMRRLHARRQLQKQGLPPPEPKKTSCQKNVIIEEKKGPCLICGCENGEAFKHTYFLPMKSGARHPELVKDDLKILHILKTVFQINGRKQLERLWEVSKGLRPSEWIYGCSACQGYVANIVAAFHRFQKARGEIERNRTVILNRITKSSGGNQGVVANEIREMYRWVPKLRSLGSSKGDYPFSEGDEMAEKVLQSKLHPTSGSHEAKPTSAQVKVDQEYSDDDYDEEVYPDPVVKRDPEEDEEFENADVGDADDPESCHAMPSCGDEPENVEDLANESKEKVENQVASSLEECETRGNEVAEINGARKLNEFFTCPLCMSIPGVAARGMIMAEFIPHLIFHKDNPIRCLTCQVFLPTDADSLHSHWRHFHTRTTPAPISVEEKIDINAIHSFKSMEDTGTDDEDNYIEPQPLISCKDCNSSPNFKDKNHFKIHQALEHVEVARLSCSLCPKTFDKTVIHNDRMNHDLSDEDTVSGRLDQFLISEYNTHLLSDHRISLGNFFWNSHMCQFCAEMLPNGFGFLRQKSAFDAETFHVISRHPKLINASYTCTSCILEFDDLEEFLQHATSKIKRHEKVILNVEADALCHINTDNVICKLCLCEDGSRARAFFSLPVFTSHLRTTHCLYLKWELDPSDCVGRREMKILKPARDHVEVDVRSLKEIIGSDKLENDDKYKRIIAHYKEKHPPKYLCPSCPKLGKMNVDDFIAHVIFHWRRPNKCTQCSLYLPLAREGIENHWKELHPSLASSTLVKSEVVNYFPGNLFTCKNCPEKFDSLQSRNEHYKTVHDLLEQETLFQCKECNLDSHNLEEQRLHKAIAHPEVASVSCCYCDEVFMLESSEGVKYLDYEALQEHIMQTDDHPGSMRERVALVGEEISCDASIPSPCTYCGQVMLDNHRKSDRVKRHILNDHGIKSTLAFSCHICSTNFGQSICTHILKNHTKPVICDTCGEEVKAHLLPEHNLSKHDIIAEGREVSSCKQDGCGYKTYNAKNLRRHAEQHDPNRKKCHQCSVCGKAFWDANKLKEHENIHANKETKPFQCEICGNSFALRNYLYIHMRLSHLGKKFPSTNRKRPKKDGSCTRGNSRPRPSSSDKQAALTKDDPQMTS